MSKMVEFTRPDGKNCSGYYGEPNENATAPAVVMIQEWWGLNDQVKGMADDLVAAGYRVLVPDLYRGDTTVEQEEAKHKMDSLDFQEATDQDIRGAVQYLKKNSPSVAVMGFCMGGILTMISAIHLDEEIRAAISWYGVPPEEAGEPSSIKIPVQGHFGTEDSFFPPEKVDALEEQLKAGNVDYDFYRYEGAEHAFGNETGDSYDAEAKKKAWERSLSFLSKHIRIANA